MNSINKRNIFMLLGICHIILLIVLACESDYKNEIKENENIRQKNYDKEKILFKVCDSFSEKSNIPNYSVHIKTLDFSHIVSAFLVGDSINEYKDWLIWDKMNDYLSKKKFQIPNSTVSIRVTVYGHLDGQDTNIVNSIPISYFEIVRFKLDSVGTARLDFIYPNIELNPDEKTVKEYIQDKYRNALTEKTTLTKKKLIFIGCENFQLFVNVALELYHQKNYSLAIDFIKYALKIKPLSVANIVILSSLYFENGNYDKAAESYKRVKSLYSKIPNQKVPIFIYENVGISYFHLGKIELMTSNFDIALEYYSKVLSNNSKDKAAIGKIGNIYFYYRSSINYYLEEIKKNKADANAFYNLALLYDSLNKVNPSLENKTNAIKYFRRAEELGIKKSK